MSIKAIFENIVEHLKVELTKSELSIFIAVAWLTDSELFSILCEKALNGIKVELMIVEDIINKKSKLDYSHLSSSGGKVHWISDRKKIRVLCIINFALSTPKL